MKLTPRDFFLDISAMAALYVSVGSLLALLFQYVDYLFPDALTESYYDPYSGPIRFAMAALVIVFPLYLFFTRVVHRELRANPLLRDLPFRRWLIYVTLFVAGATIVGDLISLINTYLSGEVTTRFILKVGVVLILAAGVFGYYWYELKGRWEAMERQSKLIGAAATLFVFGSLVAGFFIIGSPAYQRDLRFDQQRVNDLQTITQHITTFWQAKQELPALLAQVEDPLRGAYIPSDPETGAPYVYRKLGTLTFEVCAVFLRASQGGAATPKARPWNFSMGQDVFFSHREGEQCFERTIDPDVWPPLIPVKEVIY